MTQQWDIDTINRTTTSPSMDIDKLVQGLNALRSHFSGATEPEHPTAYMTWADTANHLLKQRNGNNTQWIIQQNLAEASVITHTMDATILPQDRHKLLLCDATDGDFALTLSPAEELGENFQCRIKKIDNTRHCITLLPTAPQRIEGQHQLMLDMPYQTVAIISDGRHFYLSEAITALCDRQQTRVATLEQSAIRLHGSQPMAFNGNNGSDHWTQLSIVNPTANRTIILPDADVNLTPVFFSALLSADQIIPSGISTPMPFNLSEMTTCPYYNIEKQEFIATVAGCYIFYALVGWQNASIEHHYSVQIFKNGKLYQVVKQRGNPDAFSQSVNTMMCCAVNDIVQVQVFQDSTVDRIVSSGAASVFCGYLLK